MKTYRSPTCKSPMPFARHMLCREHVIPPIPVVRSPFTRFAFARNIAWKPEQLEISCSFTCLAMCALYPSAPSLLQKYPKPSPKMGSAASDETALFDRRKLASCARNRKYINLRQANQYTHDTRKYHPPIQRVNILPVVRQVPPWLRACATHQRQFPLFRRSHAARVVPAFSVLHVFHLPPLSDDVHEGLAAILFTLRKYFLLIVE
jgi:hypothetical protein